MGVAYYGQEYKYVLLFFFYSLKSTSNGVMKNYGNCKPYNLTIIQEILPSIGFGYIPYFFGTWFYVIFTGEQLNGFRRNAFS